MAGHWNKRAMPQPRSRPTAASRNGTSTTATCRPGLRSFAAERNISASSLLTPAAVRPDPDEPVPCEKNPAAQPADAAAERDGHRGKDGAASQSAGQEGQGYQGRDRLIAA